MRPRLPGYTGIYLRHTFTMTGPAPGALTLRVWNDDGFIAWLNGQEVDRFGPAQGVFVPYSGGAGRNHEGYNSPPDVIVISKPNAILVQGTNVLCIHALNECAQRQLGLSHRRGTEVRRRQRRWRTDAARAKQCFRHERAARRFVRSITLP